MDQALQLEIAGQSQLNLLEESQAQWRKLISPASRREVRPVHILDLADELLARIFEGIREREVQHPSQYNSPNGVDDIRSIRLACRRFCDTSSHLLLCIAKVELRCSSLSRFEAISRHPIVSKGIQAVRIYLGYYDEILATDFRSFVDYQKSQTQLFFSLVPF
ncbi:hypothetical protein B0O99DRAFT_632611 [Bisporella sp. PMI_857]|nr:hypothetical protein B0O99DRAFT_632611 [Bisporella sp. PMI_857]